MVVRSLGPFLSSSGRSLHDSPHVPHSIFLLLLFISFRFSFLCSQLLSRVPDVSRYRRPRNLPLLDDITASN